MGPVFKNTFISDIICIIIVDEEEHERGQVDEKSFDLFVIGFFDGMC